MNHKRDLPADDAKSLSVLKQTLTKIARRKNYITQLQCSRAESRKPAETACLDSIELLALQAGTQTQPELCLDGLGLSEHDLSELLVRLPHLLAHYETIEDAILKASHIRILRLSDNNISCGSGYLPNSSGHVFIRCL